MEYGLWNLPTGFWQTSNQVNIPVENIARTTYLATPSNGIPIFQGSLNDGDLSSYAVTGSQNYHQPTEFASAKNVLANRSIVSLNDEKTHLDGVPLSSELMESLSSDSTHQSSNSLPVIAVRTRMKLKNEPLNYDPPDHSNGQPTEEYMAQQSYQHPMYGMLLTQMAVCKDDVGISEGEGDEETEDKIISADTASLGSTFGETPEAAPCRSPSNVETSGSGYECGECGLVAEARTTLKKHITLAHPDQSNDSSVEKSPSAPNVCPMPSCRFKTNERNEMEAHVARHVAEGFSHNAKKKPSSLALQRVRYEREEYRCQMCAYSCTIEKAFYKHLKNHTMATNVTPTAVIAANPIKISCSICGKDRTSEVEMSKHMKKHRDDRYFCCDICIFKTVQLKKLIQHRRMHTGEKPHLCPHCSYRSARRDNLRSHVRRVHKKENLYCDTFSPRGLLLTASTPAPSSSPTPSQQELRSSPAADHTRSQESKALQ